MGLALGAVPILLLALLLIPRGPVTAHTGRITGFRALSSETGTDVYATVQVDGHPTLVQLRPSDNCLVGDPITLRKARFALGPRYAVQGGGCAKPAAARP